MYGELRTLAALHLRRERRDHTLRPTELVHEAYLRLLGQEQVRALDRTHFLATASHAVRRVLLDHARRRGSQKRGGAWRRVTLAEAADRAPEVDVDLLSLEEALGRLEALDPRLARVVTMRFFGGLTVDEVAVASELSPRTVAKDWRAARAWLHRELLDDGQVPA